MYLKNPKKPPKKQKNNPKKPKTKKNPTKTPSLMNFPNVDKHF